MTRQGLVRLRTQGKVRHPDRPRSFPSYGNLHLRFRDNPACNRPSLNSALAGPAVYSSHLGVRVAVVKPVFTATAYQKIRSDLGKLNATIVDGWGWSNGLRQFIGSSAARQNGLLVGKRLTILTDVGITEGLLPRAQL